MGDGSRRTGRRESVGIAHCRCALVSPHSLAGTMSSRAADCRLGRWKKCSLLPKRLDMAGVARRVRGGAAGPRSNGFAGEMAVVGQGRANGGRDVCARDA